MGAVPAAVARTPERPRIPSSFENVRRTGRVWHPSCFSPGVKKMLIGSRETKEGLQMKTVEVFIGDRIYLEIHPDDEFDGGFDPEDEAPKSTVTIVDLVPDSYER